MADTYQSTTCLNGTLIFLNMISKKESCFFYGIMYLMFYILTKNTALFQPDADKIECTMNSNRL